MNIFVGNLPFDATEADVKELFEGFGGVLSAVLVMEKQKKAPKSRGFGFVEMPDDEQANAAIAALNNKEFMGRPLNVNVARTKEEAQAARKLKVINKPKVEPQAQQEEPFFAPVFRKPGSYKGGRRTNSYMKRKGLTEIPEAKPRRDFRDNPMRWLKKKDQPKPWQKTEVSARPNVGARTWNKPTGDVKPWKKTAGEAKPWKKATGEAKPWKKSAVEAKPWKKSIRLAQKSSYKISRKKY